MRPPWWRRHGSALALVVVGALFALPLRGLLRSQGPPMEEGFMLVFPELVLEGQVPNRDFLHLYGPGGLWVLAAVYKVFGTSLIAERLFGLVQLVGLVLALFALARPWGRTVAITGAAIAVFVIVPPMGLVAMAWVGAVALGLWSLWAGLRARRAEAASASRWALASGVLAGLALLYRLDLVIALTAGLAVALWGGGASRWRRFLAGLALGLAPYVVHLATAGLYTSFRGMVLDPVFALRDGRHLPIPSPSEFHTFFLVAAETYLLDWPLPTLTTPGQLAAFFWLLLVTVAALAITAAWCLRRRPGSWRARALLAGAAFGVGLLPQALQRPDATHLAWVAVVPFALVPVAVAEVLRQRAPRLGAGWGRSLGGVAVLLVLALLIPTFTVRRYADYSFQSFGSHRQAFEVAHGGRNFYYGRPDVAEALTEMLPVAERIAPAGGRLFVGTGDLRRTPYSDAFLYYMLPELEPATHYIEMDPGVANAVDSGLAEDLASADVVILSTVWDDWDEPNDSRELGSPEPGEVLEEEFCLVREYGHHHRVASDAPPGGEALYRLYQRCPARADG